jgi:hypothetical protein
MSARTRRSRAAVAQQQLELEYLEIEDIHEYENNPRDNDAAVEYVANSIREFGFIIPCLVDADNVLVAGHTRVKAAKALGYSSVPVVRVHHLSEDQIRAFRIVDNKLAEIATWNTDLLSAELSELVGVIDFTYLGFSREEVDCLTQVVADDCLSSTPSEDTVQAATSTNNGLGPLRTRIVIGEFVLHLPVETYNLWATALKVQFNYVNANIQEELFRRLGLDNEALAEVGIATEGTGDGDVCD